jgi:hypothetical protein
VESATPYSVFFHLNTSYTSPRFSSVKIAGVALAGLSKVGGVKVLLSFNTGSKVSSEQLMLISVQSIDSSVIFFIVFMVVVSIS